MTPATATKPKTSVRSRRSGNTLRDGGGSRYCPIYSRPFIEVTRMENTILIRLNVRGSRFELMVGTARIRGRFMNPKHKFLQSRLGPLGYTGLNELTIRNDDPKLQPDQVRSLDEVVRWIRKNDGGEVTISGIDTCRVPLRKLTTRIELGMTTRAGG